jgi:hypothetical protein
VYGSAVANTKMRLFLLKTAKFIWKLEG